MADNLTVKSGSSAPQTAEPTKAEDPKAREQAELDRLRGIAKKHHGRELDDKTLKAIVARRKAKIAKAQKLDETKQEFQSDQAKEKVSTRTDRQAQTQKAMGAKEARGPTEELPAKDAKQVRTNPDSGPKLPPNLAKATTPEQAAQLLDKMFSFVTLDGEAFDQKAYAETIQEKPPTEIKDPKSQQPSGKTAKSTPSRTAQPQPGAQSQDGKTPQDGKTATTKDGKTATTKDGKAATTKDGKTTTTPGKTALPGKSVAQTSAAMRSGIQGAPSQTGRAPGAQPGPGPQPGPTPSAMPPQSTGPALSLSTRSASASMRTSAPVNSLSGGTGVSSDGLFNAGGGLITNSSFDGMSFNWEAFNWFFTMVVMKDLHKYRREMKELRRLESKAAIASMKLKLAIKRMRQVFERNKATVKFFESVKSAVGEIKGAIKERELDKLLGDNQSAKVQNDEAMRDVESKLAKSNENLTNLENKLKTLQPGDPEYDTTRADIATERQNRAALETRRAELQAEAQKINDERRDLERQRSSARGQLGELADLFRRSRRDPAAQQEFREHLQQYRETLRGLEGHREVMPYMERRGRELSSEFRNDMAELQHHKNMLASTQERIRVLEQDRGNLTEEQRVELAQLGQRADEHEAAIKEARRNARVSGDKVMINEATMISLMSKNERTAAVERAVKTRDELTTKLASETDPDERASLESQIHDIDRGIGTLQWAADQPDDVDPAEIISHVQGQHDSRLATQHPNAAPQDRERHGHREAATSLRFAGELARNERQSDVWNKAYEMAEGANKLIQDVMESEAVKAAEATFHAAVDRTVDTGLNLDLQARAECNAMLRRHASRSQGMVNQLMQLLRMQRSM